MLNNHYVDLSLSDGDLAVENGQLRIQKDESLIQEALIRRITTPINVYSNYTVDLNLGELIIIDDDYGNISYELTATDSKLVLEQLRDNLRNLVQKESRVNLNTITFTEDIIEGIKTIISYSIIEDPEPTQTLIF